METGVWAVEPRAYQSNFCASADLRELISGSLGNSDPRSPSNYGEVTDLWLPSRPGCGIFTPTVVHVFAVPRVSQESIHQEARSV